jgi:hypothetical protein
MRRTLALSTIGTKSNLGRPNMATRAAINGFERVVRRAFRAAFERGAEIEWAGINDVADAAMLAPLLKHDSVYGPFPAAIEAANGFIHVDGAEILVFNETDPANLPWDALGVEVVLEATGRRVAPLIDLRRTADYRRRRDTREGDRLVRQRMGLREPARRAGATGARTGARGEVLIHPS